jgi:hypothetical protein
MSVVTFIANLIPLNLIIITTCVRPKFTKLVVIQCCVQLLLSLFGQNILLALCF